MSRVYLKVQGLVNNTQPWRLPPRVSGVQGVPAEGAAQVVVELAVHAEPLPGQEGIPCTVSRKFT